MVNTLFERSLWAEADLYQRRINLNQLLWLLMVIGATAFTAHSMLRGDPMMVLAVIFMVVVVTVAILFEVRYGIYLILFFSLLGDSLLWTWYPFIKNLSSPESLFFLHDALIFSPLEFYLMLTFVIWFGKAAMQRKFAFYRGILFWPVLIFMFFLVVGFLYGVGTGGNYVIGLWEVRPIFTMPLMMVLVSNHLKKPAHVFCLMWWILIALWIEGLIGSYQYVVDFNMNLAGIESMTEHSAAIHMNTLFVFLLAAWLYQAPFVQRMLPLLIIPPVLLTYLATQRRAAFLSMAIALVFMALILYKEHRRAFWAIVPVAAMLGLAYIGAFWNSHGALGLPARAIRSVIAPDPMSEDTLSNIYRVIENINISYTIHQAPLFGVGFGQKFHIIIPMADISFFVWWEYIVHNSILWIWIKAGILGFLSMLFLAGFSILRGVRTLQRLEGNHLRVVGLTATLYIVMHFLYAYVDMSWDTQSMLYVGAMLGIINSLERVAANGKTPPRKPMPRWLQMPDWVHQQNQRQSVAHWVWGSLWDGTKQVRAKSEAHLLG